MKKKLIMLMLAVGIIAAGCEKKQETEESVKVNIEETNTVKENKEETESVQTSLSNLLPLYLFVLILFLDRKSVV